MKKNTCSLFSFLALIICVLATYSVQAQTVNDDDTIRVDTGLVNLNVSIFSMNRKLKIEPLQQNDFSVFENGKSEEIKFFATAEAPFDLILLLDLSGSTVKKLKLIRKTSKKFVEATRPIDRIAIVTFSSEAKAVAPLTEDRKLLLKKIEEIEPPFGGTNFWDALQFTLDKVVDKDAKERRTAIVVLTDGVDNALPDVRGDGSKISFEELLESVKRSESLVIPIYLDTEKETLKDAPYLATALSYQIARSQLAQIADESGSILYNANKVEDLEGVYQQIIGDLGTVYSIGYQPTNNSHNGEWREVSVRLINKPELRTKTKRGYYAN
jgi:VWFA-related protein